LGAAEAPAQNSVLEKVRAAGRGIFEKYGVQWRRGPGRPRIDGEPGAADVPLNAPLSALPAGAAPGAANDHPPGRSGIVKRCYKALAKSFSGWADKIIYRKVVELSGDKNYAREMVVEISLTDPEAEAFGQLCDELAAMCGADEKWMALAAAMATVAAVGGRYVVVMRDLERQIAKKNKLENRSLGPKPI
jgi:hypothetical protein